MEDFGEQLAPQARLGLERICASIKRMGERVDGLLEFHAWAGAR